MLGKSGAHTQFGPVPCPARRRGTPPWRDGPEVTAGRDEFEVIAALRARFEAAGGPPTGGDLGIGDDAAVVTVAGSGQVVLATDLVVAGVHVDLGTCSPEDVGWKSLMVTVSDLGAMGCVPSHALLSVAAPVGFPIERRARPTLGLLSERVGLASIATPQSCRQTSTVIAATGALLSINIFGGAEAPEQLLPYLERRLAVSDHVGSVY